MQRWRLHSPVKITAIDNLDDTPLSSLLFSVPLIYFVSLERIKMSVHIFVVSEHVLSEIAIVSFFESL